MTTLQLDNDNVTKWIRWIARVASLLVAVMALLFIGSVVSDWVLKGMLTICQPKLEGLTRWTLCRQFIEALGGWADEIAATPWPIEGTILAGLLLFALLGIVMAWVREGVGSVLLIVGAVALGAFSYLTADQDKFLDLLLVAGPIFVLGLLFLTCWQQSKTWQSE